MALTKVEAAKLTQDLMVRGVIDTIVKDTPLFGALPFMDVVGTTIRKPITASGDQLKSLGHSDRMWIDDQIPERRLIAEVDAGSVGSVGCDDYCADKDKQLAQLLIRCERDRLALRLKYLPALLIGVAIWLSGEDSELRQDVLTYGFELIKLLLHPA